MDELTGLQLAQIQKALLSAFPSRYDLEAMVLFGLGENLNTIAHGENLNEVTLRLLQWAKARAKMDALVMAAQETNPDNPEIIALVNDLGLVTPTTSLLSSEASEATQAENNKTNPSTIGNTSMDGKAITHPPTINHEEPIQLFRQLLDRNTEDRYMQLLGGPNMGKSHLLTRILPVIAFQHGWRPISLDLRNQATTIVGYLDFLCQTIGRPNFPEYEHALNEWRNQSSAQAESVDELVAMLAKQDQHSTKDLQSIEHQLTISFVNDLRNMDHIPLLLVFDQVENAEQDVQDWLMTSLLVEINPLTHISVIAGGRSMPAPADSYQPQCHTYELKPVTSDNAYVDYCKETNVSLPEQSIKDFAKAVEYIPGQFANLISTFARA